MCLYRRKKEEKEKDVEKLQVTSRELYDITLPTRRLSWLEVWKSIRTITAKAVVKALLHLLQSARHWYTTANCLVNRLVDMLSVTIR